MAPVGQACLIGDRRRYVTALITLDPSWAASSEVRAAVRAAVDDVNTMVATHERIVGFELLAVPWTEESGELTPTLKKKRSVILERNAAAIARLYPES